MQLQSLNSIFNDQFFRIPDYQRGYSWGTKQLNDLWRDINNLDDEKIHYTGLLSVDPQVKNGEIHVVDGQQRLTTLIILIHVVCSCRQLKDKEWVNGKEKADYVKKYLWRQTGLAGEVIELVFGYEKDNPSHIHFKTKIIGVPDSEIVPNHTLYTNNLDSAKQFFAEEIEKLELNEVEIILKKATEQLQFLYYSIDDKLNPFVTFETLNYRGKDLTKLELLKNRLMYLSTELPDNDDNEKAKLRTDINNAWKTVYEYLGKNPSSPLDDDEFLMGHWIMYFDKYDRSASNVFANFLLDTHFTIDNVSNKSICHKDIRHFVLDIQKVVQAWYYLRNPKESKYSDEIKTWLGKLNRLGFGTFRPLIASILANEVEESKILKALQNAEQFNFVVLQLNMGNRNTNFKAVPIYHRTYEAHKSPTTFNPGKFNLFVLGDHTLFNKGEICEKMMKQPNGFYDWKGLKYFLYEYEIYLQRQLNHCEAKLVWEQINSQTIEHIYPQTPAPGDWPMFNDEKPEDHLHKLGNLMLFPRNKNSQLGNRSFMEKKTEYSIGSYSAIIVSKEENWTPDTINARQKKMLEFLSERWDTKYLEIKFNL